MYCIEESACDIVGTFGAPIVIRRPGNFTPLVPSLRPWSRYFPSGDEVISSLHIRPHVLLRTLSQNLWNAISHVAPLIG